MRPAHSTATQVKVSADTLQEGRQSDSTEDSTCQSCHNHHRGVRTSQELGTQSFIKVIFEAKRKYSPHICLQEDDGVAVSHSILNHMRLSGLKLPYIHKSQRPIYLHIQESHKSTKLKATVHMQRTCCRPVYPGACRFSLCESI